MAKKFKVKPKLRITGEMKFYLLVFSIIVFTLLYGLASLVSNVTDSISDRLSSNTSQVSTYVGEPDENRFSEKSGILLTDSKRPENSSVSASADKSSKSEETVSKQINRNAFDTDVTIPNYTGAAYVTVNGNVPYFSENDLQLRNGYEEYSPLDSLGRCGTAFIKAGIETMPTEKRGKIGQVKPSGWHTVRYDGIIPNNYLYHRCHLIAFQIGAENANERNLITGTQYLNIEGMLPFENKVVDYIKKTGNHVLYRVTPTFQGDELVARGVFIEGLSVEDNGAGIRFNVFCHNAQPNVSIDYATGESYIY